VSNAEPDGAATVYRGLSEPAYRGSFVARYAALRPRPPDPLIQLLLSLAPADPPELVVDLGAGTGLSTVPWSARARRVIGIEVNPEMLRLASPAPNVEYRRASAQQTGLADACADLVTCAQSFHWMEHESTIAEITRILRPAGVFAAYDYDWPPLIDWEVDAAFGRVIEAAGIDLSRPEKAQHVERLVSSGRFDAVREVFMHAQESVDAAQIAQLPLAFGPVARRLNEGATAEELGLDQFRDAVRRRLSGRKSVLWWSYRVRVACK
jgi:ubiquinone/menaquinone biosynthesis C-methylase UbiE